MVSGIYKLIDGCLVHKLRFETIANNLANQTTNGFRKDIISFNQTLSMNYISETDFTPGSIRHTGNDLDVALEGPGFFKVQTSAGVRYTRDGAFSLNAEGLLITHSGDAVLGKSGPIKINGNQLSIKENGQVVVDNRPVDTLMVVDFEEPRFLKKEGGSYYAHQGEENAIHPAEETTVKQNYIESSNVNPTEEMIKMLEAFRAFESAQKAIKSIDEITSRMVNDQGLQQ